MIRTLVTIELCAQDHASLPYAYFWKIDAANGGGSARSIDEAVRLALRDARAANERKVTQW